MFYEKVPSKKAKKGYTWRVKFYYVDQYGSKRRYTKSGFETKAEAQKHGQLKEAELAGTGMISSDITIAQAYDEWLKLNQDRLASNTLYTYQRIYPHLAKIQNLPMKTIQYGVLQTLFNEMNLAKSSKKSVKALLLNLFKYAIKCEYIANNPAQLIEITGKEKKPTEDALELQDIESICVNIKTQNPFKTKAFQVFMWIGYYSGLRAGEILALEWSDIDFQNRTISITKQQNGHTSEISERLKTGKSRAEVPLCGPLKEILESWKQINPNENIICKPDGSLIPYVSLTATLNKAAEKAGIKFHPHMLRHTFITNVVRSGADPKTAAQLARHSDVSITMNIYTQMNGSDLASALEKCYSVPKKDQNQAIIQA